MQFRTVLVLAGMLFPHCAHASPPPFPDEMKYPNVVPPQAQFGTYGSGPGEFNDPNGVAVNSQDEIIVADTYNHRIQVFDEHGKFIRQFGSLGSNNGELRAPLAVTVDDSGAVFVADTGNNRVVVFDSRGSAKGSWGIFGAGDGHLNLPSGIAVGDEKVYVADTGNQRVQVFSTEGTFIRVIGKLGTGNGEFNAPNDVAVAPSGELFVADSYNNRIQRFSSDGTFQSKWGDWGSYSGLLATPIGVSANGSRVFVADLINHRIQVFDHSGNYHHQWGRHPIVAHEGMGRTHYPGRVACAPSGKFVVVCEPFEHRCQVFSTTRTASVKNVNDSAWWEKGSKFHYGSRAEASASMLAIAEPDTHSVLVFDNSSGDPQLLTVLGGQGHVVGKFVRPSGMIVDEERGRVYVADGGNHRLQVFQLKKQRSGKNRFVKNQSSVLTAKSLLNIAKPADKRQGEEDPRLPNRRLFSPVEPGALHLGRDGLIYVADAHNSRILVLADDLSLIKQFGKNGSGPGELLVPNDISFNKAGDVLYIVDTYNFRIQAFDRDGKFLFQWGGAGIGPGQFIHPFGITSGQDGFVYVSDDAANRIQKFDEKGKFITSWGRWGTEPGQFYKPKGVTQDGRGRIIISDFGNHRAQIMTPSGEFISMFGIGEGYTPPVAFTQTGGAKKRIERGNAVSNGANFVIEYTVTGGPIRLNAPFGLSVRVFDAKTRKPRDDVKLSVDATMPAHYHGMNTSPRIRSEGQGNWNIDGMLLHMPGFWKIDFDVTDRDSTERAELDVRL